jgi:hypothetical protein
VGTQVRIHGEVWNIVRENTRDFLLDRLPALAIFPGNIGCGPEPGGFMKSRNIVVLAALMSMMAPIAAQSMSHGKELPAAEGKAVYQYITETSPYEKWSMWPGKKEFYPGTEPHGALLTTYVNEPALEALKKNAPLPNDSIIVKENYTPEKKLAAVTVMYKKAGFNPKAADWFWLKYGPEGKIETEGKVDSCINCHRAAQGDDFLYTNDAKKK